VCILNSQLVGDSFDETEQIYQQQVELRRVGGVNAPVGSRRKLVANCVHTADATQLLGINSQTNNRIPPKTGTENHPMSMVVKYLECPTIVYSSYQTLNLYIKEGQLQGYSLKEFVKKQDV